MHRFSQLIRENQSRTPLTVAERRQQMEHRQARLRPGNEYREHNFNLGGRAARWIETPNARDGHVVLYLHGGAYIMGSIDTHRELMIRVSQTCAARVLAIDYRLAPEHPFPAALEDAQAAYRWLLAQDLPASRLMLAGDSAGGGLALATLLALRDAGTALPAGAILLSPWTDLSLSGTSITSRAAVEPMLALDVLRDSAAGYRGGNDARHPLISPHFGEFHGLPPLLIQVGDAEILLDDSRRLASAAKSAGVAVEFDIWPEAFHVFQMFPQLPETTSALSAIGRFFKHHAG